MTTLEIDSQNENNLIIEKYDTFETFESMKLNENILRGIYAYGFEKPSPIQNIAIKPIIDKRDMIAQAQSGTGKTGAFTIGSLQLIDFNLIEPQVLVMAPTRELAQQINNVFKNIGDYCNIKTIECIGGGDAKKNEYDFKEGCHAVIGTPGRIFHMINVGAFKLLKIKQLIIDEADNMLEKGFKEQLYEIFSLGFPEKMKIALFSATLTPDTYAIADKFMKNYIKIAVKKEDVTLEGIEQYYIKMTKEEYKIGTLIDLWKLISIKQAIVYCNNKNKVITLATELNEISDIKFSLTFIHGDMEQMERNKIMKDFRAGKYRVLISTDLLARGIDIQQVSLVINYDIPINKENYMHRIGRTGRYGRKGVALNFITDRDEENIKTIETYYDLKINELPGDVSNILN
jgi:translation initiation factor 4A